MSALDQAFVKAYAEPAVPQAPASLGPPLAPQAGATCGSGAAAVVELPETGAAEAGVGSTPELASTPGPPAEPQETPKPAVPKPARPSKTNGQVTGKRQRTKAAGEKSPPGASMPTGAPLPACMAPGPPQPSSPPAGFRPLLEVDALIWPAALAKLAEAAAGPLGQLADHLLGRAGAGQKLIGWQGCRRGDGCTTLLLATAQRLARQGVKMALIDADCRYPRLAQRLGLAPPCGWREVLSGQLPLAEVVIESLRDQMVLVPWCAGAGDSAGAEATAGDPADTLETLGRQYEMVFVDLGRDGLGDRPAELYSRIRPHLRAVVLVHHVRKTPKIEADRICQELRRAGTAEVAVVENFV